MPPVRSFRRPAVLRSALVIVCTLAASAASHAEAQDDADAALAPATPEDAVAQIDRLRDGGRAGAALRRCDEVARAFPDAGVVYVVCGDLQLSLFHLDAAERSFARASELQPKSAYPLARQAFVLSRRGDDTRAGQLAKTALELDPGSTEAQWVLDSIGERQAIQAGTPEPAADAPAHVVWAFMEAAERGRVGEALAEHFDGATMRKLLDEGGIGGPDDGKRSVRAVGEGMSEAFRRTYAAFHGYRIVDAAAAAGETESVVVQLHVNEKPDLARAAHLRRALESDLRDSLLPASLVASYNSLEPEERRAFLERIASEGGPVLGILRFELQRRGRAWKIVDIAVSAEGVPVRTFSMLLQEHRALGELVGKNPARRSAAYELGRSIGKILFGLGALALMVLLLVAAVRRGR